MQTNVVPLKKRSHILGSGGAMRKVAPLTEAELDAQIATNRQRYADHFDAHEQRLEAERAARPSVIPLDNSLLARAIRAFRWAFQLKGPRP